MAGRVKLALHLGRAATGEGNSRQLRRTAQVVRDDNNGFGRFRPQSTHSFPIDWLTRARFLRAHSKRKERKAHKGAENFAYLLAAIALFAPLRFQEEPDVAQQRIDYPLLLPSALLSFISKASAPAALPQTGCLGWPSPARRCRRPCRDRRSCGQSAVQASC